MGRGESAIDRTFTVSTGQYFHSLSKTKALKSKYEGRFHPGEIRGLFYALFSLFCKAPAKPPEKSSRNLSKTLDDTAVSWYNVVKG